MSEDASVNVEAPIVWPDPDSAYFQVRRMQTKLHQWARDDISRRFDDLYNLVYDPAFLVHAWERVSSNAGARSAGIDRTTVLQIQARVGVEAFLLRVRDQLKARTFRPEPVRQVMIPKGSSGKVRKLGIPTVTDRVVQAALKAVLEPVFEADFRPCSYGFRPNRRAHDAIAEIHFLASKSYEWVLEADIAACFDSIDHTPLMYRLRKRIKDKRVCALVKAFLAAGVMTRSGSYEESPTGTPQGGILSPLLANIALSELDEHLEQQWETSASKRAARRRNGLGNWRLIRYADDFVVMVSGERRHAEQLWAQVANTIAPLGLELAADKTQIVHIDQGFDFLGFHIQRRRKRGTQKHYVYTTPSRKSIKSIKGKVRIKTHRSSRNMTVKAMLSSVDNMVRGWAIYFRHGVSKATFSDIDHFTWWRLATWIRDKHSRIPLSTLRRNFCDEGWRLAHEGATYRGASSVSVRRYRYRGAKISTPWTPTPATH